MKTFHHELFHWWHTFCFWSNISFLIVAWVCSSYSSIFCWESTCMINSNISMSDTVYTCHILMIIFLAHLGGVNFRVTFENMLPPRFAQLVECNNNLKVSRNLSNKKLYTEWGIISFRIDLQSDRFHNRLHYTISYLSGVVISCNRPHRLI
jgi:hypothetical protein